MKRFALVLALVPTLAFAKTSYNEMGKGIVHDCSKDPDVSVNAGDGSVTFTGKCDKISLNGSNLKVKIASVDKLSVNGAENTVDIEAVDKLSVNGSDNAVTYKKGVTGAKPKVSSTGTGNKITQSK